MMRRFIRGVAVAAVLLGGAGMIGVMLSEGQRRSLASSQPVAPAADVADRDLLELGHSRIFFAHMSVGFNVLSGVDSVYVDKGAPAPSILDVGVDDPTPTLPTSPVIVSTEIGQNGDPLGKVRNFDRMLRSGLAGQIDVALIKFCYVDVGHGTDVDALFGAYKSTLDALQRDFPQVTFLHSTVPLTVGPRTAKDHVKVLLRRDHNATRLRYNALVRQTYGSDRLFDLAAVESTAPEGKPTGSLYDGYSSDGEHLNERGSRLAAESLIRLLANQTQS